MTAPAYIRGRIKRDVEADAMRAARAHVEDGVTFKLALGRFRVGKERLAAAIKKLRAERAQRTGGAPCGCAPDQIHSKHHRHQRAFELSDSARPKP